MKLQTWIVRSVLNRFCKIDLQPETSGSWAYIAQDAAMQRKIYRTAFVSNAAFRQGFFRRQIVFPSRTTLRMQPGQRKSSRIFPEWQKDRFAGKVQFPEQSENRNGSGILEFDL